MSMDPRQELVTSWSLNADAWTDAVRGGHIASRRDVTDAAIVEAVLREASRAVLDIGCGEGWLCRALAQHVPRIVGVDASPALVDRASTSGGADFFCLSYDELITDPEPAGRDFDTIVCNFALLDDRIEPLLSALTRIAAPGGRLIIQTVHPLNVSPPYVDGWRSERFDGFGAGQWAEMPWHFHTLETWITMISTAWTIVSLEEPRAKGAASPASLILIAERRALPG